MVTILTGSDNSRLLETDKTIIRQVNNQPEAFFDLTIKKFAQKVNISISAVSKSVRRLGFEDYREFQKYIFKSYSLQKENHFLNLIDNNNKNDIALLQELDIFTITETIKILDPRVLNDFILTLMNVKKVWVVGTGSSFLAAKDLANFLYLNKVLAFSTNDILGSIPHFNTLNQDDLLIFISEHYNRQEYQNLTSKLKNQHVKIALITGVNKFFINKNVDFVINFFVFNQQSRPRLANNVKIQQFFVNDIIINSLVKKQNSQLEGTEKTLS